MSGAGEAAGLAQVKWQTHAIIGVVRFSEIAARVNGLSTPIFGVSWTPPPADVEVARRVVAFV